MAQYLSETAKKVTTLCVRQMKAQGEKISMLTSYDYTTAGIVDAAGIDIILVGDSASNVMAGNSTTLPITLDEMALYGRSVVRAVSHAMVVCDMPFGTYQVSAEDAVRNAIRLMQQTGADAVKLEGGEAIIPAIRRIIAAGIPVMGHLGLTPQSINKFGTYAVRAREDAEAAKLLSDVELLNNAGCCGIVLEKIPAALTAKACALTDVPIIGIGAGNGTDAQILVMHDAFGFFGRPPKFARNFLKECGTGDVRDAVRLYLDEVKNGTFPSQAESFE